ncbi:UbiA family prenyltransferase [Spiractinospora alimapuensis]|uniref:SCO3242 family prenyltransferase n=1 Tax=Spiractinospora alimapuensis TaxID=2820884 RepID=UPI001F4019AE|nr:UbiA family prenyltransferase [Spiractinospora alimapuensis]QVQ52415.1 UbiA family prenyltransferase [Spiractinospora alimapuensis]
MRPRDLLSLVRAPAALSVPGDVLAGAAAAGFPYGRRTVAAAGASVCLYWAGMALNDYADRELDAEERPERPIPSGRVTPGQALMTASVLTATGLGLASAAGGRRALGVAAPLAATVWAYDLALKPTVLGPVAMATARGLDVAMGAGAERSALRAVALPAACMAAHTFAVTGLSRDEVSGTTSNRVLAPLATTGAVTSAVLWRSGRPRRSEVGDVRGRVTAVGLALGYAATTGRPLLDAMRRPTPQRVRTAVGAGILAMMPLQAALAAGSGAYRGALGLVGAHPLARRLARRVSPT